MLGSCGLHIKTSYVTSYSYLTAFEMKAQERASPSFRDVAIRNLLMTNGGFAAPIFLYLCINYHGLEVNPLEAAIPRFQIPIPRKPTSSPCPVSLSASYTNTDYQTQHAN